MVTLDASNNRIAISTLTGTGMTIGATPLASTTKTLSEAMEYTVTVVKRQGTIRAWVDEDSTSPVPVNPGVGATYDDSHRTDSNR